MAECAKILSQVICLINLHKDVQLQQKALCKIHAMELGSCLYMMKKQRQFYSSKDHSVQSTCHLFLVSGEILFLYLSGVCFGGQFGYMVLAYLFMFIFYFFRKQTSQRMHKLFNLICVIGAKILLLYINSHIYKKKYHTLHNQF